ncbi:type II secretion system minor pseudopilin GspH [Saccharospirillum salsuginis]|uniref:Type II secretion system protein H n=1 Tax=Saccharospirillum salsuginis TaxID=418750 RepID=A0A918K677_9GAMM|nr:type II secretion system minor pseudopilin GspH [Saccharospirillum salsuginis]GGX52006.1 hypothetical protein GCM10007392_19160 [Saccharospirillum salsuginis]
MTPALIQSTGSHRRPSGFTLIELLVVIVIIGVAASAVRLAVTQKDPLADIQHSAEQLAYTVGQAQDRVLLSNTERGILFLSHGATFLEWREGDPMEGEEPIMWSVSEAEPIEWQAPDEARLSLQLDSQWVELNDELPEDPLLIQPHVVLLPSEDYTPAFQLDIEHEDIMDASIQVIGDGFNRLEVKRVEN